MSAESGVPTFRDRMTGLWARHDPQDIATPEAFRRNPQLVWDWHVHLAESVRAATPNAGHRAIAALQDLVQQVTVITQNIDGLHARAGSREIIELHGNLLRLRGFRDDDGRQEGLRLARPPRPCPLCGARCAPPGAWNPDPGLSLAGFGLAAGPVPRCPKCGARLRPDVVWFNEMLDPDLLDQAWAAMENCDAVLCVGASLEVEPAASLPFRALECGHAVIEINPAPTALSALADASVRGGAASALPRLVESVWGSAQGPGE
ncbi:MAG: NAD-dependent deacylase [Betaproteobacteria bacterium]|nr:NAD-dependent deacylase [Betaproteobacteria bacterium]